MKAAYTYKDGSEVVRTYSADERNGGDITMRHGGNSPVMVSIWGNPIAEFIDWAGKVVLPTHLGGIGVLVNGEIVGGELLYDDPIFG